MFMYSTCTCTCSLACQTFEKGRERLVTIASNPWTVGMFGMFIIKISTRKINSSRMRQHVYKQAMECLTCQAERLQANNRRRLHSNSAKHHSLIPLLQELVCHPSAGLLVLHDDAFLCRPCPCFRKLEEKL